jgi:uncharacterized protein YraI
MPKQWMSRRANKSNGIRHWSMNYVATAERSRAQAKGERDMSVRHWIVLVIMMACGLMPAAAQSSGACPGFDSRLAVGMQARVLPGTPNNVRSAPNPSAERVGSIPGEGIFSVLEGPTCSNGITWWRVDYNGVVGWTAEGTVDEHFVEPAGALGVGGAGSGSSGGTGGSRFVPQNVIEGIAFGGFGGGGGEAEGTPPPTNICMATLNADNMTYSPTITAGAAGFALERYALDFYPLTEALIANPPQPLPNNARIDDVAMLYPDGNAIDFGFAPSLCVASSTQAPSAVAPDGAVFQPSYNALDGVTQVLLPVQAYITPGVWTLVLADVRLQIEIAPPPQVRTLTEWRDTGLFFSRRYWWGGVTPDTRIVLITFDGEVRETTSSAAGFAATEYDGMISYITGFVPEDGQNIRIGGLGFGGRIGVPSAEAPNFFIPQEPSERLLYNVVWRNQPFPGTAYTCPDAMPITGSLNTYRYTVTTDRVNVRESPGTSSPVVTTLVRGENIGLLDGVECADGANWWNVVVFESPGSGGVSSGWIAEGVGGEYFIAPS